MGRYIGRIVKIATTWGKGVIADHIDVIPDFSSDCLANYRSDPSLRRYNGFVRKDFNVADGPVSGLSEEEIEELMSHQRNFRNTRTEFTDAPLEEAVRQARKIAESENLVLYLRRQILDESLDTLRKIVWHPTEWRPHKG